MKIIPVFEPPTTPYLIAYLIAKAGFRPEANGSSRSLHFRSGDEV